MMYNKGGKMKFTTEADSYIEGNSRANRILYSNDGLIFISYDHANTFYELIK